MAIDCYLSEGRANFSSASNALVIRFVSSLSVAPRDAKTYDLTLRPNSRSAVKFFPSLRKSSM